MQAADTGSHIAKRTVVSQNQHRRATYSKVMDKRKRPVRGLWERNGRYYAQLTVEDQITGIKQVKRVPMEGVGKSAAYEALSPNGQFSAWLQFAPDGLISWEGK